MPPSNFGCRRRSEHSSRLGRSSAKRRVFGRRSRGRAACKGFVRRVTAGHCMLGRDDARPERLRPVQVFSSGVSDDADLVRHSQGGRRSIRWSGWNWVVMTTSSNRLEPKRYSQGFEPWHVAALKPRTRVSFRRFPMSRSKWVRWRSFPSNCASNAVRMRFRSPGKRF